MYVGWWIICAAAVQQQNRPKIACVWEIDMYVIAHFAFSRQNYRFIAGNFKQPLLPASSYLRRYLGLLYVLVNLSTSARNLNSWRL